MYPFIRFVLASNRRPRPLLNVRSYVAGNHAGALALAARALNVPCHLVMPHDSARPKLATARAAKAHITLCEPTAPARSAALAKVQATTGAAFVPPYDAVNTILGQGTVFLEMEEQAREDGWGNLACVVVPVGGGGLLAGMGVAAHGTGVRVFGAGEHLSSSPLRVCISCSPRNAHRAERSGRLLSRHSRRRARPRILARNHR